MRTFCRSLMAALPLVVMLVVSVEAGQIVIGKNPTSFEKLAADELKYFLERITPDKYQIIDEDRASEKKAIFLGQTEFAAKNQISAEAFEGEELILKSVDGNLIVSGGRPVGTLYGVYELLEQSGVYFLDYGDDAIVLPEPKPLKLDGYSLRKKPSLANRAIHDSIPAWMMRTATPEKYARAYWRYQLRNRANGSQGRDHWRTGEYRGVQANTSKLLPFCHNFHNYVSPEKYFADHPEYFSMDEKGERFYKPGHGRRHGQLCLTNADVLRITLESLRDFIRRDREAGTKEEWPVVYDISAMDSSRFFCRCPECDAIVKAEGESGLLLSAYINPIAETIAKEYPEIKIRTFAYSFHDQPPATVRPAPNVIIWYCDLYLRSDCYRPISSEFNRAQLELFNSWRDTGARITLWDYWNMGGNAYFAPPRIETGIDAIIQDIRFFQESGVDGIFTEYPINPLTPQMFHALDRYVGMQLMYDVTQNPEALIDRFLKGYYGAAAPEMRKLLDLIRDGVRNHPTRQLSMRVGRWNFVTPDFLLKTWQLLKSAESKTSGVHQARVRTEMITPLWEIISRRHELENTFADFDDLKEKCREVTMANILKHEPKRPEGSTERPTSLERLDALLMEIPFPPKFIKQRDEAMLFGSASFTNNPRHNCRVVDDPDSPTGKAVSYDGSVALPLRFGVANADIPQSEWGRGVIRHAPQDEKYHWYHIPRVTVGSKTWMYGFNGALRIDLTSAYRIPSGEEDSDFNVYDVWYSAKFEENAFVEGSKKKNAVSIDYVVLTRPSTMSRELLASDGLEERPWLIVGGQIRSGETRLDTEKARTGQNCCVIENNRCRWDTRTRAEFGEKFEFEVYAKGNGSLQLGAFFYPEGEIITLEDQTTHQLTSDYQRYSYSFTSPVNTRTILVTLATDGKAFFDDAAFYRVRDDAFSLEAKPGYQMIADTPSPIKFVLYHDGKPVPEAEIDVLEGDDIVSGVHADSGQTAKAYIQKVSPEKLAAYTAATSKIKFDPPVKVLYLGDSLTDFDRGYNHTDIAAYFLGGQFAVFNYAVRGDDIERVVNRLSGKARVPHRTRYDGIFDRTYDVAFVFLGHNDTKTSSANNYAKPLITLERQRSLYEDLIERLKKAETGRIILMSPTSSNYEKILDNIERMLQRHGARTHSRFGEPKHLEAYAAVLEELARKHGLEYLDVYNPTRTYPNKPALFNPNDGVHLSIPGHQIIALEVLRYLARNKR